MSESTPPPKHELFLGLLQHGWVSVILDARQDGIGLPDHLRGEAHLRLDYGLDMPTPITDLQVTPTGISATLSFNREPFLTFIPWKAVFVVAQVGGPGVVYADSVPAEFAQAIESTETTVAPDADPEGAEGPKPAPSTRGQGKARRLSLVPAESTGPPGAEAATESGSNDAPRAGEGGKDEPPKRPRRPTLRLVK